uniref:Uncharacterized protein n=1 Tax=Rhodnius prolixus TaxID=13249 RepID=T1HAX7_RHOPR
MASVFWDCQGVILIEYMPQRETSNSAKYCKTLKKLWRAIPEQEKRHADKESLPAARQCHEGTARPRLIGMS